MKTILEMKEKRAKLIKDSRDILDKAHNEKRSMDTEENQMYERMDADIDKLNVDIERFQKQLDNERSAGEPDADRIGDQDGKDFTRSDNPRATEEYREAFSKWITRGSAALTSEEYRAMQADSDAGGGFLVAPQQMVMELLKNVDDQVAIRQYARVIQLTSAKSLGVPTLDKDADDFDWTAELKTGKETELEFGKRELRPHPLAKRAKISNTLLRMAAMNPEAIVNERLSYVLSATQEKSYMTGDGVQKPLGLFTASANGISTSRDISTDNTATSVSADGLINAKYGLKGDYLTRARWIFHRDALKQIRKLKDANGQYLWQAGISGGAPDRILELPYLSSEFAPNTFTTGKYVGLLGDMSKYWIVDALDMQMQRLTELYAETNQTGYIARYEGDAAPVLEEAFVRVKLG